VKDAPIPRAVSALTSGRGHAMTLARPYVEYHQTLDEWLGALEAGDYAETSAAIDRIIDHYGHGRPHSSLSFLRLVDYYRGSPEALLAERRRKLHAAGELRKQEPEIATTLEFSARTKGTVSSFGRRKVSLTDETDHDSRTASTRLGDSLPEVRLRRTLGEVWRLHRRGW